MSNGMPGPNSDGNGQTDDNARVEFSSETVENTARKRRLSVLSEISSESDNRQNCTDEIDRLNTVVVRTCADRYFECLNFFKFLIKFDVSDSFHRRFGGSLLNSTDSHV